MVIGGSDYSDDFGFSKVEEFNGENWNTLEDFPRYIKYHSCLGIDDGLLVFGGSQIMNEPMLEKATAKLNADRSLYGELNAQYKNGVYIYYQSVWKMIGYLKNDHAYLSLSKIGSTIFLVSGVEYGDLEWHAETFPVETVFWDAETSEFWDMDYVDFTNSTLGNTIRYHEESFKRPLVFPVSKSQLDFLTETRINQLN
ncbi:Oidioi.mRNA.OKI2018_I69.PAR.g8892.t1.cds [Oikopleura dioica]|uniref:Oidioi.mRNA.OKI2018_I69.PAR.g8892.t1.cds n=1 Tax=Oikopleura dioica TaxID=34765 RepID=A0ABN7RM49_OIKDI|nr:Oidioi.mRNA.OKI2018_I69.PAR.g8892.t1.cds [Oikopleura dioica]